MNDSTMRRLGVLIPTAMVALGLIIVYTLYRTPGPLGWTLARAAALFGYGTIFWTILSSEYIAQMRKLFGRPYLRVHHLLARIGLVLIVIHPVTVAVLSRDPTAFVPQFSSLRTFLTLGGRPALYIFFGAALAAVAHKRIKHSWKVIHWLNYLAFTLAFIHSWLLGTNVATGLLKFIWPAMAAIVLLVLLHKRLAQPARKA